MTWSISRITVPPGHISVIYGGGPPRTLARIGNSIQGNWIVSVPGIGYISLDDAGHQPGGPHYWAVRINGSQLFWYDGGGDMQITVNQDGSFAINGGITGYVKAPLPSCNMAMIGGASYCYCVFSSDAGPTQIINVRAGAPRFAVSLLPAVGGSSISYASISLAGPNGIVINSSTAESQNLILGKGPGGLISVIVDQPAVGNWTVTVSTTQQLPWYLFGHVYDKDDDAEAAKQTYLANTQCHEILAELGLYVPPPPSAAMGVMDWLACAWCQTVWYGALALLVATQPEIVVYRAVMYSEAGSVILQKVKRILQIDSDSDAGKVIDVLSTILDPLEWPLAICKVMGKCK